MSHVATSGLRHRHHVGVHIGVLIAAVLMLPIAAPSTAPADGSSPVAWLLATLTTSIALPFFAVSATAPLLQRWYTRRTGRDPYFLYAASNTGSLVGLLAYPLLIEPTLTLAAQRQLWSIGLGLVAMLVAVCGLLSLRACARDARDPLDINAVGERRAASRGAIGSGGWRCHSSLRACSWA